jgi:hypothetical protein
VTPEPRRPGGRRLGSLLALPICAFGIGCADAGAPERIILIVVDTLRRDQLSVYGAEIRTPNVARLARRGRVYGHGLSSFHQTSMSMAALFTGRTPSLESGHPDQPLDWNAHDWCGMRRFASEADDQCVPASVPTLGEIMKASGYWTVGIASNPMTFAYSGLARGFDRWQELQATKRQGILAFKPEHRAQFAASRAGDKVVAEAIEALRGRETDRFFLYVHFMDVHDWHFRGIPYTQGVEEMDLALGTLLDYLEGEDLFDGAVVVLTSDHGESFQEPHLLRGTPRHFGNPSFEAVLQVPLIVVGARLREGGPVRSDDLFHFLVRVAGSPAQTRGLLEPGELLLSERAYRTYRLGRWKSFWRRPDGAFYLVNLEVDPGELEDVAARFPAIAADHKRRVGALAEALAASDAPSKPIDPQYLEMLRSLGYVE